MSQKLNPEVKSETTDKASTQWGTVAPQPEKKDQGWLQYINEKLHQWPLWVKLVGTKAGQEKKNEFDCQLKTYLQKRGYQVVHEGKIFHEQWISRSGEVVRYNYYHDQKTKLTFFFPFVTRYRSDETTERGKHIEKFPSQFQSEPKRFWSYMQRVVYVMKTSQALKEIKDEKFFQ